MLNQIFRVAVFAGLIPFALAAQTHKDGDRITFERDEVDDSGNSLMLKELDSGTVARGSLKTGMGYNTNPYSLKTSDIQGSGSFVFKLRPSFSFVGKTSIAKISVAAAADTGLVFGQSQPARFLVFNGIALGNGDLNLGDLVMGFADANLTTSREVEELFLGSLTQLKSDFHVGIKLRPSRGAITLLALGEAKNSSYFDFEQPLIGKYTPNPNELASQSYYFRGKMAWDFRPEQELFTEAKFGTWLGEVESASTTITPLWVNVGAKGLIAPNVQGRLTAGYANTFVRLKASNRLLDGASLSFSMLADLRWRISDCSDLFLKLERDLAPSSIFLEVYTNTIAVDYRQKFADKFTLVLAPYLTLYEYGKPLANNNSGRLAGNHRNDLVIGMKEEFMYFFNDWISVGVSHKGKFRWSNAKDFQVFTLDGKIADLSGQLVSFTLQNEGLLFASIYY